MTLRCWTLNNKQPVVIATASVTLSSFNWLYAIMLSILYIIIVILVVGILLSQVSLLLITGQGSGRLMYPLAYLRNHMSELRRIFRKY